jgi:hypothetical protein
MDQFKILEEAVASYTLLAKPGQPMPTSFAMEDIDGQLHAVLRGPSGVLAAYLVREGHMLRKVPYGPNTGALAAPASSVSEVATGRI